MSRCQPVLRVVRAVCNVLPSYDLIYIRRGVGAPRRQQTVTTMEKRAADPLERQGELQFDHADLASARGAAVVLAMSLVACGPTPSSPTILPVSLDTLARLGGERILEASVAADGTIFFSSTVNSYRLLRGSQDVELLGPNPVSVVRIMASSSDKLHMVGGFSPKLHTWHDGAWSSRTVADVAHLELFDVAVLSDGRVAVAGSESTVIVIGAEPADSTVVYTVDIADDSDRLWHVGSRADGNLVSLSTGVVAERDNSTWRVVNKSSDGCQYLALVVRRDELWFGGRFSPLDGDQTSTCLRSYLAGRTTDYSDLGFSRGFLLSNGEVQPDGTVLLWGEAGHLVHVRADSVRAMRLPVRYFGGAALVEGTWILAFQGLNRETIIARILNDAMVFDHAISR